MELLSMVKFHALSINLIAIVLILKIEVHYTNNFAPIWIIKFTNFEYDCLFVFHGGMTEINNSRLPFKFNVKTLDRVTSLKCTQPFDKASLRLFEVKE